MIRPNPLRGEVALRADGETHILKLTLGALAVLEARLGCGDLTALAERLEAGRVSAGDLIAVLESGFHGAGREMSGERVAAMQVEGGAAEAIRVCAALLRAAFTGRP